MHEPWSPPMYPSPIQGFVVASDFDDSLLPDSPLALKNVFEPRSLPAIPSSKPTPPLQALHTSTADTHSDPEPSPISPNRSFSPISPKRSFSPPSHVPQAWNRRFSESSASSDRPLRRFSFDTDAYQRQRRQSVQSQGPVLKWLRKATVFLVEIFDEADPLEPEDEFPAPEPREPRRFSYNSNTSAIESDSDSELEKVKSHEKHRPQPMEVLSTGKRVYSFASERPHWLALLAVLTALPLSSHVVYEWLQWAVIGSAVLLGPTYTAGFYPVLGFVSLGFMVNFPAQVCAFGLLLWLAREWHTAEVLRKSQLKE
ncbi:hypothetical protein CJU89_3062 [Yarrowia sp. B02]|nr:hypothetical protein CJU89_3062 [Yarrowia sp. B02]